MRLKNLLCLLIFVLVFVFTGCSDFETESESPAPEIIEEKPADDFIGEEISDEEIKEKIFSVFSEIGVNTKFLKEFKKAEDETEAVKYSFVYKNNDFVVTLDENSGVSSINIAEGGAAVYLKGNEPKDINDFVITESMVRGFNWNMQDAVAAAFGVIEYELTEDCVFKHDDLYYYMEGTVLVGEGKTEHYMEVTNYFVGDGMCLYSVVADGKEAHIDPILQSGEKPETEPDFGD